MSETPPPGSWPGLESHAESVLGSDPLQTARDLQGALEGMTKQLAAVQKTVRRGKFVITALAVLLVLVVGLGVGVSITAIQASNASAKASTASTQIHASVITGCQVNNDAKVKQAGLWAFVIGALQPPASETAAQKAAGEKFLGRLEQHVASAYKLRNCQAAYKSP